MMRYEKSICPLKLFLTFADNITVQNFFLSLNSSPMDEPGNLCLKCWQGSEHFRLRQGGIHGNPSSGNHPCKQLPTADWHCHTEPDQWKILT